MLKKIWVNIFIGRLENWKIVSAPKRHFQWKNPSLQLYLRGVFAILLLIGVDSGLENWAAFKLRFSGNDIKLWII
jgi:hypothetical protein